MRQVDISELKIGDTLGAPVFRRDGGLLVDAGVEITRTLVRALETARIKQVVLIDSQDDIAMIQKDRHANEAVAERQTKLHDASENELERRFLEQKLEDLKERLSDLYAPHRENQMMMELHDAALAYLSERLLRKEP